jgi:hypothetical protein
MTMQGAVSWLKGAGGMAIMAIFALASLLLFLLLIAGGARLADFLYPWVSTVAGFVLVIALPFLGVLALFRKTRGWAGTGLFVSSYVLGAALWLWSFLLTYTLWGPIAVVIGLALFGVGVIPLAILAGMFHGMWAAVAELVIGVGLVWGTRVAGMMLSSRRSKPERIAPLDRPEPGAGGIASTPPLENPFSTESEHAAAPTDPDPPAYDRPIRLHTDGEEGWELVRGQRIGPNRVRLTVTPLVTGEDDDPLFWGDVLEVEPLGGDDYRMIGRAERGAYRHYSWVLPRGFPSSTEFQQFGNAVGAAGGEWERISGGWLQVHIPLDSSFDVAAELNRCQQAFMRRQEPEGPDPESAPAPRTVLSCAECGQQMGLPRGKGRIRVTCPRCAHRQDAVT